MAETTGSTPNSYAGSNQDNTFGNNRYWIQWIEYENPSPVNSLSELGFDLTNGDYDAANATVTSTDITHAGGVDTSDVGAIAPYIGETNANGTATELFATRFVSTLTIDTAGTYDFRMNSDDGSMLFIDGVQVINHDGLHDGGPQAYASIPLSAGQHDIVIIQYNYQGPSALNVYLTGADYPTETEFDAIPLTHLSANAGDDVVDAGDGADTIHGGEGDDILRGGAGADTLHGEAGADTLEGGAGDDTLLGGAGADTFVITSGGGADTASDFNAAEDLLDTSGLDAALGRQLTAADITVTEDGVSGDQTLSFPGGESITLPPGTLDLSTSRSQFNSLVALGVPACFCPGVRIATPSGPRAVETLAQGDLVETLADGPLPVLLVLRRIALRGAKGRHMPLRIDAGAFGRGLPRRALRLSPQHRVALRRRRGPEALTPARALLGGGGVRHETQAPAALYLALLLPRHAVIFAEGLAVESYLPGPATRASMGPDGRAAIRRVEALTGPLSPALPLLGARKGRRAMATGARPFGQEETARPSPCPAMA
ncbi:Hint domain-containing protein [Rhodovulum sp. DZ06]|uniref:Hint domain-containing protein n=1 Tax=Rhodovulum sp. DZ06 TaxID=3425126 RepID=UPI003D32BEE3